MQSHFRQYLDLSILCESTHATKLSRSHVKVFQFINKSFRDPICTGPVDTVLHKGGRISNISPSSKLE